VYNAQIIKNRNNTLSCLLIDVKKTFNYVSLTQLINILKKLNILHNIINWITCFLQKQVINLAFNRNKQKLKQIVTRIS